MKRRSPHWFQSIKRLRERDVTVSTHQGGLAVNALTLQKPREHIYNQTTSKRKRDDTNKDENTNPNIDDESIGIDSNMRGPDITLESH